MKTLIVGTPINCPRCGQEVFRVSKEIRPYDRTSMVYAQLEPVNGSSTLTQYSTTWQICTRCGEKYYIIDIIGNELEKLELIEINFYEGSHN